jgi:peptide deformylase
MLAKGVLSLSAPQVGFDRRVFVIAARPVLAVFNPVVVDQTTERVDLEETCATFPGCACLVRRSKSVRVRFTMADGVVTTQTYTGLTARLVQHEMDHLDGILHYELLDPVRRDRFWRDLKKADRKARRS